MLPTSIWVGLTPGAPCPVPLLSGAFEHPVIPRAKTAITAELLRRVRHVIVQPRGTKPGALSKVRPCGPQCSPSGDPYLWIGSVPLRAEGGVAASGNPSPQRCPVRCTPLLPRPRHRQAFLLILP